MARMGRTPPNPPGFTEIDRERLYYLAWSYMSPAGWAAGFLAVRRTFTDSEWAAFWKPYSAVLGEPPV